MRLPANVSGVATALLALSSQASSPLVQVRRATGSQAARHRFRTGFQRRLLRHPSVGGPVTVNGDWPDQPEHIVPFINPCLTEAERHAAEEAAASKSWSRPLRIVTVGRLEVAKGTREVIEVLRLLRQRDVEFRFDAVGDGPERADLEAVSRDLGESVTVHGPLPREELDRLLRRGAHRPSPVSYRGLAQGARRGDGFRGRRGGE